MASGRPVCSRKRSGSPSASASIALLGAGVLPDDRGGDGPSGGALPDDRRLALVGDADRRDLVAGGVGPRERLADHEPGVLPDLGGVVLDPAGAGEQLRVLALAGRGDASLRGDEHGTGARGALVDRQHVLRHPVASSRRCHDIGVAQIRVTASGPRSATFATPERPSTRSVSAMRFWSTSRAPCSPSIARP